MSHLKATICFEAAPPGAVDSVISTPTIPRHGFKDSAMDPASIASAFVGMQSGQLQFNIDVQLMKDTANQQKEVAQLVAGSVQSASLPADVGQNLDIAA